MTFEPFLSAGGGMASAIAEFDWAATSLGSIESWPAVLKIAVGMMVSSKFPKCIVWGEQLTTIHNDAFRSILADKPEALGRSFRDVWAESWHEIGPIVQRAYAGEATFIENFPLWVHRFGQRSLAYFTFCYSPIRDEMGRIGGMLDTVIETTGIVETERRIRILNDELTHRLTNTLAVASAVASQTLQSSESPKDALARLLQRFNALGAVHRMAAISDGFHIELKQLVDQSLSPHTPRGGVFSCQGPYIVLPPKQALSLALALNELATNAVKYGALSVETGHVDIEWKNADGQFRFHWRERGGPPVAPPRRSGFGTRLIEEILPHDFGGTVELTYDPDGLRCDLTAPLAHIQPRIDDA